MPHGHQTPCACLCYKWTRDSEIFPHKRGEVLLAELPAFRVSFHFLGRPGQAQGCTHRLFTMLRPPAHPGSLRCNKMHHSSQQGGSPWEENWCYLCSISASPSAWKEGMFQGKSVVGRRCFMGGNGLFQVAGTETEKAGQAGEDCFC